MTRSGPRPYHRTTLDPVQDIPAYAVIIRAIHERGQTQDDALAELTRRGLWLTTEQRRQADLSDREGWTKADYPGAPVRITHLVWPSGGDMGEVRIQHYGAHYRVALFAPGVTVCSPGDTPKTEPECSQWCNDAAEADRWFDLFVDREKCDGWSVRP